MGARLGQHFLFDPAILGRIADAAVAAPDESVLEIGAGKGTLTRELSKRARSVTSIELDRSLAEALRQSFAGTNVEIIEGDALAVAWPAADVIAGNIPYQITSPLIERALTPPRPRRIVFLVQREVAARLAAQPGDRAYGAMSAGVQLVAEVELLFSVKAGSFKPPPEVESAVVRLVPREIPLARSPAEEDATRRLIKLLFQRRRNQIQRSLRELTTHDARLTTDDPRRTTDDLVQAGFNPAARPEELAPADFVKLARLFPIA